MSNIIMMQYSEGSVGGIIVKHLKALLRLFQRRQCINFKTLPPYPMNIYIIKKIG